MQDNQMGKEIIEIGNVSADNKRRHQSGVVLSRGGWQPPCIPLCGKTLQRSSDGIIVLGAIGNTARQNRDNMRIFDRCGVCPTLKSHISKESIMVVRKWGKSES